MGLWTRDPTLGIGVLTGYGLVFIVRCLLWNAFGWGFRGWAMRARV